MELSSEQKARIVQGAQLLDVQFPEWWKGINLDDLDIDSFCRCVLGQLYGTYFDGARMLWPHTSDLSDEASKYGFYPCEEDATEVTENAEQLATAKTSYWRRVIIYRRELHELQ